MVRCLLIRAPRLANGERFTRPLQSPDSFFEALSSANRGIARQYPLGQNSLSFPVWLVPNGGRVELAVPHDTLQNAFQSPGGNKNLLFLRKASATDLRLTYRDLQCHYRRTQAPDFGLGESPFFDHERTGAGGHLLREVPRAGARLTRMEVTVAVPNRPPDGWLNPWVVRLDGRGDVAASPRPRDADNAPERVFRGWLSKSEPLAMVPDFRDPHAIRNLAWGKLLRRSFSGGFSAVEQLIAGGVTAGGGAEEQLSRAGIWSFLALDSLGGTFVLEGHGEAPRARWQPPASASPNALWLAQQWASHWRSGQSLLEAAPGGPAPASPEEGYRPYYPVERGLGALATGDVATPRLLPRRTMRTLAGSVSREVQADISGSLEAFLEFAVARGVSNGAGSAVLLSFFRELVSSMAGQVPCPQGLQNSWLRFSKGGTVSWDLPVILDHLAQQWIAPSSTVLVAIPQIEPRITERYMSLCESMLGGYRGLLWGLLRGREARGSRRTIRRAGGWWNDWHASIFDDDAAVTITYPGGGFTLGSSALGHDGLGTGRHGAGASPIRFSLLQ